MKRLICLLVFVCVFIDFCHPHVFYRNIMSEDDDVTYGLPLGRVRRDLGETEGRIGPFFTHVKTNKGGTFKWGTKHMVGQMFAGNKKHQEEDNFEWK